MHCWEHRRMWRRRQEMEMELALAVNTFRLFIARGMGEDRIGQRLRYLVVVLVMLVNMGPRTEGQAQA